MTVIGSLKYITMTRPYIQFIVNRISQFMCSPKEVHWISMKKILRFLSGSQNYGITLGITSSYSISGFCDADRGSGDTIDKKSQIGILVYVGNVLIEWSSKKKIVVAHSS